MSTIEIPADVRDNSETVTDYAFMRDRAQSNYPYHTVKARDGEIKRVDLFPHLRFTHYTWTDTNPDEQRCRFDMIVDPDGMVVNLFHTEYFTRVACAECEYSYASVYQLITTGETDDEGVSNLAVPRCDHHADRFRRACFGVPGVVLYESERLRIGQY